VKHRSASRAGRAAGPSQRQLRVGEELRHLLAQILGHGDLRDPALAGLTVTVTEVRVSPDLKNATAFVVPLGGGNLDEAVAALNHAAGFFRGRLGGELRLRYVPRVVFAADRSFDAAERIEEILARPRVHRDVAADAGNDAADAAAGEDGERE